MEERRAYLCLAATPGLGPRRVRRLVADLGSAAAALTPAAAGHPALAGGRAAALRRIAASDAPERLEAATRRAGQALWTPADAAYPRALRELHDPPPRLFLRGPPPAGGAVAVVGTRDASRYGLAVAEGLAAELAARGLTVLSGLALGIDAQAHRGALRVGGSTAAVLGGGLDRVAPARHAGLADRIVAAGGTLLGEHPPGAPARPGHFPARNRLIAALARAIVVVEAGRRSGALITAELGLELGRAVLAVPGRAGEPRAEGVLELLRDGAALATRAEDVLAELDWGAAGAPPDPPPPPDPPSPPYPPPRTDTPPPAGPTGRVLAALRELADASLEGLAARSGVAGPTLAAALVELELAGLALRAGPGRYRAAPGAPPDRAGPPR